MRNLNEINEKIKTLKKAREILQDEYSKTDFHKKKEANPHSSVPHSPEDEEIYKLLYAIQQLEVYVKKFQDEQFEMIKEHDDEV
jgi:hypothetical protein